DRKDLVLMTIFSLGELRPGKQRTKSVFEGNKSPEILKGFNGAFHLGAGWRLNGRLGPRIVHQTRHAEGNLALLRIEREYLYFDCVSDLHDIGWMANASAGVELRDVHKTFHAGRDFNKRTEVHQFGDVAAEGFADLNVSKCVDEGIVRKGFHGQSDAQA